MSVLADEKPPTLSAGEGQKAVARAASIIDFNLVERVNGMGSENGGSQMITQGGNSDDGTSESCDGKVERACRKEVTMVTQKSRKKTKAGRYTSDITYEEMQQYFHLPGEKAAKELGVGLTILKRLCRKFGLARWPYKKPTKKAVEMERMRYFQEHGGMAGGMHGPGWMNPGSMQHVQGPFYGMQGTWQRTMLPYPGLSMEHPTVGYSHEPRLFQPIPSRASVDNWRWNVVLERLGIQPDDKPKDLITQDKSCKGFIPVKKDFGDIAGQARFVHIPPDLGLKKPKKHEEHFALAAGASNSRYLQGQNDTIMGAFMSRERINAVVNASTEANSLFKGSPTNGATTQEPATHSEIDSRQQLEGKLRLVAQYPGLRDTIKHLLEALCAKKPE